MPSTSPSVDPTTVPADTGARAATLDLSADVTTLTAAICDIESVSQNEAALADAIEAALRPLGHLEVVRDGNTVVARTSLGRSERVVLAGHIDTVPLTAVPNLPTRRVDGELWGRGTVDMKGGVAVMLRLLERLRDHPRPVVHVYYDREEGPNHLNGIHAVLADHSVMADVAFAVVLDAHGAAVPVGNGVEVADQRHRRPAATGAGDHRVAATLVHHAELAAAVCDEPRDQVLGAGRRRRPDERLADLGDRAAKRRCHGRGARR